jgi:hypothetical protein
MGVEAGAHNGHPPASRKVLMVLLVLLGLYLGLSGVKLVALSAQRSCLRMVVVDVTHALSKYNLDYWWDFGTLLGLIRGGDIIYTEVDADISIPLATRDVFFKTPGLTEELENVLGYHIQKRDEHKLRLFGRWGWFADMDVWTPADNDTLFLATGSHSDKSVYYYPRAWLLPTRPISRVPDVAPLSPKLPPELRVPAQPLTVLEYRYGKTWRIPRKFDKGNDPSHDPVELFLWGHAMWVYEIFLSLKCLVRIFTHGLFAAAKLTITLGNFLEIAVLIGGFYLLAQRSSQLRCVQILLFATLILFLAAFLPAFMLAIGLSS